MSPRSVFLNVPYDKPFQPIFLAYVVGVIGYGLIPRASLEIQGSTHRINHIVELLHSCEFSIHDMSRIDVPRFNMPFELGLAYHHSLSLADKHSCFIFAGDYKGFEDRLSDLKGIDIQVHDNDISKVFSRLCAAFVAQDLVPTVIDMKAVYELLTDSLPGVLENAGSDSLFHPMVFSELVFTARAFWNSRPVKTRSRHA